jgi:hypothetical protein
VIAITWNRRAVHLPGGSPNSVNIDVVAIELALSGAQGQHWVRSLPSNGLAIRRRLDVDVIVWLPTEAVILGLSDGLHLVEEEVLDNDRHH